MNRGEKLAPPVFPWATVCVLVGCALLQLFPTIAATSELARGQLEHGQIWRLWTSSFVHYNTGHFFWNAMVVTFAGFEAECRWPSIVRAYYIVGPAVIGLAIWQYSPGLEYFRGLSGIGAGLVLIFGAVQFQQGSRGLGVAIFLLLALKVGCEEVSSRTLLTQFETPLVIPATIAHVAGAASAGLLLAVSTLRKRCGWLVPV